MKIAVFGASVSAQTLRHDTGEVTGYSEALRRRHLGGARLVQVCHPGNRLSDGGLYRLDELIAQRPALCIVEPLVEDCTRGRDATEDEVRFVYARLLRAGIVPLTLFLPEPPRRTPPGTGRHAVFQRVCRAAGLPSVTVDVSDLPSLDAHFRGIHTTALGAELFAGAVAQAIADLGPLDAARARLAPALPLLRSDLRAALLPHAPAPAVRRMVLRLRNRGPAEGRVRAVQPQTIGPFSPVLEVVARGTDREAASHRAVWDPHCHYERRSYVVLDDRVLPPAAECTVEIGVSPQDPPYATSRRPVADWPAPAARMLRPLGPIKLFSTVPVEHELVECSG